MKPKHVDVEVLRILVEALSDKFKEPQLIQSAEKLFVRLTQEVSIALKMFGIALVNN